MLAFRSVVSVLLRALGAFSLHPQGRTRAGSDATVTGEPASPSRQMIPNAIRHLPAHATAGLATTVGFLYVVHAGDSGERRRTRPGRPLPWLILQLLAAATVVATVATAVAWRHHRRNLTGASHARLGVLMAAGLVFLPWAAYWGLLIPQAR